MVTTIPKSYLHDRQPEIGLLRLAAKGGDAALSPTLDDFAAIADSLNNRRMVVLFKWFWKHADVVRLTDYLSRRVSVDGLVWYLFKLSEMVAHRRSLHWIERINLFHAYGLSRLFGREINPDVIKSFPFFSKKSHKIYTLADLSAYNVSLMLKEAGAIESLKLINLVAEKPLLAEYGMYQIYYYQGIAETLEILKTYVSTHKQSIIPQTIAGIFEAEPRSIILSKTTREMIYDELITPLPRDVILKLERLDKRYARSHQSAF